MKISPGSDDAPEFIVCADQVVNGLLRRHKPPSVVLVKIDNWFGSKWLGFSGKVLGAVGSWHKPYHRPADNIRIPPFVPNRVVSQRRFAAPDYEEIAAGKPIHRRVPSDFAVIRKAATNARGIALVWYSGNSKATGRGAVMAYVPINDSYWPWYAAWEKGDPWHVSETWDITRDDLSRLIEFAFPHNPETGY